MIKTLPDNKLKRNKKLITKNYAVSVEILLLKIKKFPWPKN